MVVLGRIVAPYGIKGLVRIHPFGDDPFAWGEMPCWWLGTAPEGDEWRPVVPKDLRSQGKGLVAQLEGADDRDAAEKLVGLYVAAPREAMPKNGKDEYYWGDLVGLAVINEEGDRLGSVATLLEAGANQVLVVRDGEQERLLPFVGNVVKDVAVAAGVIHVAWHKDW